VVHDELLLEAPEALAQVAADLLLEVMQDPRLQTRYLRDVLPLVAEASVGGLGRDPLSLRFALKRVHSPFQILQFQINFFTV